VPPSVTQPLEPLSVVPGQPAKFRVEFSGFPAPLARWFRGADTLIVNSADFYVSTTEGASELVVRSPRAGDSCVVTCVLESAAGTIRTSANLSVIDDDQDDQNDQDDQEGAQQYVVSAKAVTTRTLDTMKLTEGDTIRFDIRFEDGRRDQLTFSKDDVALDFKKCPRTSVSVIGDVASLRIEAAKVEDSGIYACRMVTPAGEARCKATVVVEKKKK